MNSNFSVLILAAGEGKRMENASIPKVLALLKLQPLLYYVLNTAIALEPQNICIIVGHKRELVMDYVKGTFLPNYNQFSKNRVAENMVTFAVQEKQLGTGHAVQCSEHLLGNYEGSILILSGDVPLLRAKTLKQFIQNGEETDLSVLTAIADNPFGYGRIVRNSHNQIEAIVEEKDATEKQKLITEINSGIYFANAKLLYSLLKETQNTNSQQEFYLTDIVSIGLAKHKQVVANTTAPFSEIAGVNTAKQLLEIEAML